MNYQLVNLTRNAAGPCLPSWCLQALCRYPPLLPCRPSPPALPCRPRCFFRRATERSGPSSDERASTASASWNHTAAPSVTITHPTSPLVFRPALQNLHQPYWHRKNKRNYTAVSLSRVQARSLSHWPAAPHRRPRAAARRRSPGRRHRGALGRGGCPATDAAARRPESPPAVGEWYAPPCAGQWEAGSGSSNRGGGWVAALRSPVPAGRSERPSGGGDGGRGSRDGLRPCAAAYRQVRLGAPGLRGGCRGARGLGVPRLPWVFPWAPRLPRAPGGAAAALRGGGGGAVTAASIPAGSGRAGTGGGREGLGRERSQGGAGLRYRSRVRTQRSWQNIPSFRESALEDKVSVHWKSENNTISEVSGTKVFSYGKNMKAIILMLVWTFITVLLACINWH